MSVEGKKSRLWLWLVVLVIGILLITSYVYAPPASPSYDGRSAESWLADWVGVNLSNQMPATMAATHAFNEMGTNGVHFLVNSLDQQNSVFQKVYETIFYRLPPSLRIRLPGPINAYARIGAARRLLFNIHDPAPEQTVSRLVQYLKSSNAHTREYAATVIIHYARNYKDVDFARFRPDLIHALSDTNDLTRIYIVTALSDAKLGGPELIPALQPALTNSDSFIRFAAQSTLDSLTATNHPAP